MEKQNVLNLDPEIHLPTEDAAVKASTTTTTANPVVVRDIVTIVLDPDLLHHTIATTIVHGEEIENTTMKVTKIQRSADVDFDFYLYFFFSNFVSLPSACIFSYPPKQVPYSNVINIYIYWTLFFFTTLSISTL